MPSNPSRLDEAMSVRRPLIDSRSKPRASRISTVYCLLSTVYFLSISCLLSTVSPSRADSPADAARAEFFESKVRPVLANSCFGCHGPDKQKAGLRLDSRAALLAGGDNGPVIVPGKAQASMLIKAIHYDDSPRMPPKGKLGTGAIDDLARWIDNGAVWPEARVADVRPPALAPSTYVISAKDRAFWSFQPVGKPALPRVHNADWPRTPIDAFILSALEERGLTPALPADRRTLLRRVTFDLIGLPPTPAEIANFLNDSSSDAYTRVVERLLASPHYGERWARHWLDIARYGEDQAHTFEARKYPQGFRYRDWLIQAFNRDLPYDRFILEQIAADLLPDPNLVERLPALGYFALGPVYYGDAKKLDQYDDRIDTLTRGFMGLTVACARCHDHKFDPIPTRDYYALAGVFASSEYAETPLIPAEEVEKLRQALSEADKKKKVTPKYPLIHALKDAEKPTSLRVCIRGNPDNLGEEAPRHFLSILAGDSPALFQKGSGGLELARAIASPENPLTARVFVNRVWAHHFGKGLVRTPSNFGHLGEQPSHPALLDDLARRFIDDGWSIKSLQRQIVLSAAYQQSTQFDSHCFELDPENRLVWRMNRRRLEVEVWRDAMLTAAQTLDAQIGGPSSDLARPDNRRRTLYGAVSRHELNSLLRLFDFPDPNLTADERPTTTVPLQQLFVLNSEFMVQNAKALASRMASAAPLEAARIQYAYVCLYGRPPSEREMNLGLEFLSAGTGTGEKLTRWEQYAQALLAANEFLYVD
jgi:mono/diheme cytochrome c family protein